MTDFARSSRRRAVSLIELLVVVGLIGVLVGLLMPAVQQVRAAADRASCQNRLRQIALGLHGHHDVHGAFPIGHDLWPFGLNDGSLRALSWRAKILPFVDAQPLHQATLQALKVDTVPHHNPPHVGLATVVPVFACHADSRLLTAHPSPDDGIVAAFSGYLGVEGSLSGRSDGVLPFGLAIRLADVTDGTSQTVMVGERPPSARLDSGWWYCPHPAFYTPEPRSDYYAHDSVLNATMYGNGAMRNCVPPPGGLFVYGPGRINNQCDMYHFWSLHPGGANFAFADGSVRFLGYAVSPILAQLASRSGGEVVELP